MYKVFQTKPHSHKVIPFGHAGQKRSGGKVHRYTHCVDCGKKLKTKTLPYCPDCRYKQERDEREAIDDGVMGYPEAGGTRSKSGN